MVDRDILRAKTSAIRHHTERITKRLPLEAGALERDEDLRNIVLMDLQQAIQGCIDLAVHVCSHDELGTPEGPASAFALLARKGWIAPSTSLHLAGAAGLRNIIVHRYGTLDYELLAGNLARGIEEMETFLSSIWERD